MKSNLKRTVTMLFSAVMMLWAVCMMFTSCSDDKEITADIGETLSARKPVTLTVYGITGDTTTPEAVEEVEKRLNRLSESEYSTTLELRLYTESEYRNVIEEKYVKLQHDSDVAKFCENANKIGNRVDKKMNKLLTEAEQSAKNAAAEKAAKKKAEADAKAAAELAAAIEAGEAVAEPVDEDQVDIVFIADFNHYTASINAKPEPVIVPLDEYLKLDSKILTDYIHPTLLSAAKLGGATYGLPINKGIDAETTYCLLDRELVEKYQFDTTKIMNFANIESFLADVKAGEPDVIPLLRAPEEIQGYDFYDNIIGHPIGITNPEFGDYAPVNCRSTYSEFVVTNFFEMMSDFRNYGFLPEIGADTTGMRFAVDIRKGNDEDVKRWEEEGYIVEVYKTARATTQNTLGAMYAISAYSKYPARCMEILEMLYTDADFKNIFTFGVEDVNYTVNPDNTITRLNDEYVMDFMKSGNTFIGLLDEGMDPDYVKNAVAKNFGVKRHGFLAFQPDLDEAGQTAIDYYVEQADGVFETLRQGVHNPDLTYNRLASTLNRGYINDNVPGIKAFLNGENDIPSKWSMQFDEYKTTIPADVTIEEKNLASYIQSNKNN